MGDGIGKDFKRNVFAAAGVYEVLNPTAPDFKKPDALRDEQVRYATQAIKDTIYFTPERIYFHDWELLERTEGRSIYYGDENLKISFRDKGIFRRYCSIVIEEKGFVGSSLLDKTPPLQIHFSPRDREKALEIHDFIHGKNLEAKERSNQLLFALASRQIGSNPEQNSEQSLVKAAHSLEKASLLLTEMVNSQQPQGSAVDRYLGGNPQLLDQSENNNNNNNNNNNRKKKQGKALVPNEPVLE